MFPIPLLEAALLGAVALAAVLDLAWRRIPNRLVLAGLCVALALQVAANGAAGALAWGGGALAGLLLFLPHYLLRGMAAGDVKLMAMVGAFAGPAQALQISVASILAGGVVALVIVLYRGRLRATLRNLRALLAFYWWRAVGVPLAPVALSPGEGGGGMPYGLAIALGTAVVVTLQHY